MIEEAATLFAGPAQASELKQQQEQQAELYEKIGRLKMELEWLKKKLPRSCEWKRQQVDPDHDDPSIRRQGIVDPEFLPAFTGQSQNLCVTAISESVG